MKQQERSRSFVALLLGLGVVTALLVTGILTLNRFGPNQPLSIRSTGMPTHIDGTTLTANMAGTQKAISHATWMATTRTPENTQVPFPTGTYEGSDAKFTAEKLGLVALNAWYGDLDGFSLSILAGSPIGDPEQGAVEILIDFKCSFYEKQILTPTKHGAVRVIAEQNNRLTLAAADGEIFYFDAPARQFVTSLNEVIPALTPPPCPTRPVYGVGTPMPTYNPYPMPTEPATEAP